jgi:hypothetical protein
MNEYKNQDVYIETYDTVIKPSDIIAENDVSSESSGSLNAYDLIVGQPRPMSRKETKDKLKEFISRGKIAPEPIRKTLEIQEDKKRCWFPFCCLNR